MDGNGASIPWDTQALASLNAPNVSLRTCSCTGIFAQVVHIRFAKPIVLGITGVGQLLVATLEAELKNPTAAATSMSGCTCITAVSPLHCFGAVASVNFGLAILQR